MTAIQAYEAVLVELNKVKAPSLSVNDFNYLFNKGIQQYVNQIYNSYEINQQRVDDIRVLRGSVKLSLDEIDDDNEFLSDGNWETYLPDDYLHILNCVVAFKRTEADKCGVNNKRMYIGAKRLTSDANPQVITNYYLRPSYRNPYYYINNVNSDSDSTIESTANLEQIDGNAITYKIDLNFPNLLTFTDNTSNSYSIDLSTVSHSSILPLYRKLLKIKNQTESGSNKVFRNLKIDLIDDTQLEISLLGYQTNNLTPVGVLNYIVDKNSLVRYGNSTRARMEIRCGDNKYWKPEFVSVDYIKSPQRISIDEDLLDDIEDNSQIVEFPDYVVYEIINQVVKLILENIGDTNRLQTAPAVDTTVAPPLGTQAQG